jgi:hypothetical protein
VCLLSGTTLIFKYDSDESVTVKEALTAKVGNTFSVLKIARHHLNACRAFEETENCVRKHQLLRVGGML